MTSDRTLAELLAKDMVAADSWQLRALCRHCVVWRTVPLSRVARQRATLRVVDVVARLACGTCKRPPDSVWAELRARAMGNRLIERHEVLRGWQARGEQPPEASDDLPASAGNPAVG